MVDAGPHSSVCVLETGEVYSWGDPGRSLGLCFDWTSHNCAVEGQLGHGSSIEEPLFCHYQIKARKWQQVWLLFVH